MGTNFKFIFALGAAAFAVSCSRAGKETSHVVIQLPETAQKVAAAADPSLVPVLQPTLPIDPSETDELGWSSSVPTGVNSGTQPFNCYAVGVAGAEPEMQRNICGRLDGDHRLNFESGVNHSFRIGQFIGAAYAGQQLSMEVPAGIEREFYLIGFHAASATACKDLTKGGAVDRRQMSRPYYLARSGKMSLSGGGEVVVPMEMKFDQNTWFDLCRGPDIQLGESGGGITPVGTKIVLKKDSFPANRFRVAGSTAICNPLDVEVIDAGGRVAQLPSSVTSARVKIFKQPLPTGTETLMPTFPDQADCLNNASPTNTFFVVSPTSRRWIRNNSGTDGQEVQFRPDIDFLTPITVDQNTLAEGEPLAIAYVTEGAVFELVGPREGVAGQTHKYRLSVRATTSPWGLVGQPGASPAAPRFSLHIAGTGSVLNKVFATNGSGGCAASGTSLLDTNLSFVQTVAGGSVRSVSYEFCMTFDGDAAEQKLSIQPVSGTYTTYDPEDEEVSLITNYGGTSISRIRIDSPLSLSTSIALKVPQLVSVVNLMGSPIANNTGEALAIVIKSGQTSVTLSSTPNCLTPISESNSLTIPSGVASAEYYICGTPVVGVLQFDARAYKLSQPTVNLFRGSRKIIIQP